MSPSLFPYHCQRGGECRADTAPATVVLMLGLDLRLGSDPGGDIEGGGGGMSTSIASRPHHRRFRSPRTALPPLPKTRRCRPSKHRPLPHLHAFRRMPRLFFFLLLFLLCSPLSLLRITNPRLSFRHTRHTPCPCMRILRNGNRNRNRMRMRRRMGMLRRRHGTHVVLVLPFVGGRRA